MLTFSPSLPMINPHSQKTSAGRGNPFSTGVKAPNNGVFLCLPFSAALCRSLSVMAGLFGQRSALAAPVGGFPPHLSLPPDAVESISGGYPLSTGDTAMSHPRTTQGNHAQNPRTQDEAVTSFIDQMAAHEIERKAVMDAGLPALQRLATIANNDTGQAATVRRFLLGLYNGHRFPLDLTTLRGLDKVLFDDCMDVLRLDARATVKEVHQYFKNGGELFESWANMEVSK